MRFPTSCVNEYVSWPGLGKYLVRRLFVNIAAASGHLIPYHHYRWQWVALLLLCFFRVHWGVYIHNACCTLWSDALCIMSVCLSVCLSVCDAVYLYAVPVSALAQHWMPRSSHMIWFDRNNFWPSEFLPWCSNCYCCGSTALIRLSCPEHFMSFTNLKLTFLMVWWFVENM